MASTLARMAIKYGPAISRAARSRKAYLKYGALANEAFHLGYNFSKKAMRRYKRGRRRMSSPTKKRRVTLPKRRRRTTTRFGDLGDPKSKKTIAKRFEVGKSNGLQIFNTRTLYEWNVCTFPSRDPTNGALNARERDQVTYIGLKTHWFIENNTNTVLYMNMALVVVRNNGPVVTQDFFRADDMGANNTRSTNFSNLLTSQELHNLKINTDLYDVIFHRRTTLGPAGNAGGYHPDKPNWKRIDRWIKVGRKIAFDNGSTTVPENASMRLLLWWDAVGTATNSDPLTEAVRAEHRNIIYFKDV